MGLKIKKQKKRTVKKTANKVELNIEEIKCGKSLSEITQNEIREMIRRISYYSREHGLAPVIENIQIRFDQNDTN